MEKTIYPGFIDLYAQYGVPQAKNSTYDFNNNGPKYYNDRSGANSWNAAVHSEENWFRSFSPNKDEANSFIQNGFTVVQSAQMNGIFRGKSFVTSLGLRLANDEILKQISNAFYFI